MKFKRISEDLLKVINSDNINNVTHCATRLRINVKDIDAVNDKLVREIDGVLGIVKQGNTAQIILGPDVEQVYAEFITLYRGEKKAESNSLKDKRETRENLFSRMLSFLAAAFLPTIPVIVATGLITALLNVLVLTIDLATDSPTYELISAIANTGFFFLPLYVGYGTAKQLNINPVYGVFLGAVLLNSGINGAEDLSLFGLSIISTTYSYTALP